MTVGELAAYQLFRSRAAKLAAEAGEGRDWGAYICIDPGTGRAWRSWHKDVAANEVVLEIPTKGTSFKWLMRQWSRLEPRGQQQLPLGGRQTTEGADRRPEGRQP